MSVNLDRLTEERLSKIVTALSEAFTPDSDDVKQALMDIINFHPESTPAQFTSDANPYYDKRALKRKDIQATLKQDAEQPFMCESYLYNLLGKEDARTLLGRMRRLCQVLGYDMEKLYEPEEQ